ncbi:MAG: GHMP kinase [Candidatus Liptonbacteria bacterium]|nr:GHMP kinase [Candidatus Liptonbacteria bacterium]
MLVIVVRAPLRISFVGGGTDLADFYRRSPGRVISTTIDKYVYVVINRTPLIDKVSARYSKSETAAHPSELEHTRIKAALLDLGIHKNIEIGSFATLPAKTGLGSSSSFSVALMKGLHAYQGKKINQQEAAEAASRLEIELVREPIGKQDQYAASFGGFNIIQFNPDESVEVRPVLLDYKKRLGLENHLLLFFTGITRAASSILTEQKSNIDKKFETLKEMAASVHEFSTRLLSADYKGLGGMLHQGWLKKKSLASNVSNSLIDDFYAAGMDHGAWGGKVLGAGGGGCVLFLAPPEKKNEIREAVRRVAQEKNLADFRELPVKFVQCGTEVLYNGDYHNRSFV